VASFVIAQTESIRINGWQNRIALPGVKTLLKKGRKVVSQPPMDFKIKVKRRNFNFYVGYSKWKG
jgi:hypothetical protein